MAGAGIGGHEFHPGESAGVGLAEELGPERFVLDAEHLAAAVVAQPGGDHDGFGHDVAVFADMDVGGVQPDADEGLMAECSGAQHRDVSVEVLADPAHGRAADAGVAAECFDEVVDLACRGAGDVRGHDHRPQRAIDP